MSYDIAIWDDPARATAGREPEYYRRLAEGGLDAEPHSPKVMSLLEELATRRPGESDDDFEQSPWSTWPLTGEVSGRGVVIPMRFGSAAIDQVKALAVERGLVVYDPQLDGATSRRSARPSLHLPERLRLPVAMALAAGLLGLLNKCSG